MGHEANKVKRYGGQMIGRKQNSAILRLFLKSESTIKSCKTLKMKL